ncbi:HDOD domain-containing protein [Telluria mixta]|uniref:HDOD domain-containing protein n=1 Tax=Telluria mixta TaxID=34071 RepID=A0ABT2BXS9_9BURK|nr:HDOD domain-containing protein [Telluria mixta]MCS0629952.1 HDOD domain-containing protein [Telluria mixta]WEM96495.1 HDOD domain-containing protein [Telluria mixta]
MKNWISRLRGGSDNTADTKAAPAAAEADEHPGGIPAEIEATYYRWLTASSGYDASDAVQTAILDQVRALARDPASAAELVPRVPEVIPQLLRSLQDEASNADLARQVAQDVVLVAEVIREANSAYYRPMSPVKTVEAALMMLGQNGLRMLLARVAFRPIIKLQTTGFTRLAAPHVWAQSEKCALAASLMAPGLTAGAFEAYLSGLMQNLGLVVGFRLADRLCEENKVPGSSEFGAQLLAEGRLLSAAIAKHWDFPQEVADAIAHAGDAGDENLAQALALGDRIAKLRMLIDSHVIDEDDDFVTDGLDNFQRRCLGKLGTVES